jgi:hypothetical protein
MARVSAQVGELFGQLGASPEVVAQQVGRLDRKPLASLERLGLAYGQAAVAGNKFAQRATLDARVDLPPFGSNPAPGAAAAALAPYVSGAYAPGEPQVSLHRTSGELKALLDPRQTRGARLVRLVQSDARVRAQVERLMGEAVLADGRSDARLSVVRGGARASQGSAVGVSALTSSGAQGGMPTPPSSGSVYDLFMAMDQAVMDEAARVGLGTTSGYGGPQGFLDLPPIAYESTGGYGSEDDGFGASGMSGAGLGGGPFGPGRKDASTDEAVLRVKRMLDRREQMYNIYRSTFDKYNEAAKASIDAMRG